MIFVLNVIKLLASKEWEKGSTEAHSPDQLGLRGSQFESGTLIGAGRRYATFLEDLYEHDKRCMLAFAKLLRFFRRGVHTQTHEG